LVEDGAVGRFYAEGEVGFDEGGVVDDVEGPGRKFVGGIGAEVGDGLQKEISGIVGGVYHEEGTSAGMVVPDVVPLSPAVGLEGGEVVLSVVGAGIGSELIPGCREGIVGCAGSKINFKNRITQASGTELGF